MPISIRTPQAPQGVDYSGLFGGLDQLGQNRRDRKAEELWMRDLAIPQQQSAAPTLSSLAPVQQSPDYASQRVSQAHAASGGNPPQGAIASYIRHAAQKRGIDPETAIKVAMSEGGLEDPVRQSDVVKNGVREQSYGPFQLYMGGGLGNEFQQATGMHPADRNAWQKAIDFALDKAKENGWGAWYGAAKAGIGDRDGIGVGQSATTAPAGAPMPQMAQAAQQATGGLPISLDTMRAMLRSETYRPLAVEIGRTYQQARSGDPEAELRLRKLAAEVQALENPNSKPNIVNAGDGMLYDANAGQWIQSPGQQGGAQGFRFDGKSVEAQALNGLMDSGQLTPEQAQQLGAGKTITGPNGEIIFMTPQGVFSQAQGGQPQPVGGQQLGNIPITEPKVTVDEKKAMTFADRMATSGAIIDSMGMEGSGIVDKAASRAPFGLDNYLTSDAFKKVDQAKRDFINAQLRRESGAVIADSEFDNANRQYFPQPNDPPEVIEQKRRNRQIVIEGMKRDSGPTYKGPSKSARQPVVIDGYTIEEVD